MAHHQGYEEGLQKKWDSQAVIEDLKQKINWKKKKKGGQHRIKIVREGELRKPTKGSEAVALGLWAKQQTEHEEFASSSSAATLHTAPAHRKPEDTFSWF